MASFSSDTSSASSSSSSSPPTVETTKAEANESFLKGDHNKAEALYSNALDLANAEEDNNQNCVLKCILYSNRSAARLNLEGRVEDALQDANKAIVLNPVYAKAYLRKANALQRINDHRGAYTTWIDAQKHCEGSAWLRRMAKEAEVNWISKMKEVEVTDANDLLERYSLLQDTRQKLCTLAHFWNYSSCSDRLSYLMEFLELIGGSVGSDSEQIEAENMREMPMHNYEDLPRSTIEPWVAFLESLSSNDKVALMKKTWELLTSSEQNLVIVDLKTFFCESHGVDEIDESES